ncbi:MAG: hypothetical protein LW650_00690 [Planctomycetaceae bacterium]|nr:hypothetical protein [Phycisphaerales bacterium]MCE2652056.1 hypothetical protein [Planctomycetaceae bacterium]
MNFHTPGRDWIARKMNRMTTQELRNWKREAAADGDDNLVSRLEAEIYRRNESWGPLTAWGRGETDE